MLFFGIRRFALWVAAGAVLAWATAAAAAPPVYELFFQSQLGRHWAYAATPQVPVVAEPAAERGPVPSYGFANVVQLPKPSDYYIGLGCSPAPEMLRAHLGLKQGQGLVVEQVLPNSPAAAAKLERFDVLVKAGDKSLGAVPDLVAAVDAAKDKKLVLELHRRGKSMKVEVTPVKRPVTTTLHMRGAGPDAGLRGRIDENAAQVEAELSKAFEEAKKAGRALPNLVIREFHPGIMLPPGSPNMAALPGNVSISVTKKGDEPTKITVARGDQKWEITENETDKLPPDLRPMVERTLAGLMMRAHGTARIHVAPAPGAPATVAPSKEPEAIQKKLDQLDRKLDELRKSLDELRAPRPAKAEK